MSWHLNTQSRFMSEAGFLKFLLGILALLCNGKTMVLRCFTGLVNLGAPLGPHSALWRPREGGESAALAPLAVK